MRICDWSPYVCSSDWLPNAVLFEKPARLAPVARVHPWDAHPDYAGFDVHKYPLYRLRSQGYFLTRESAASRYIPRIIQRPVPPPLGSVYFWFLRFFPGLKSIFDKILSKLSLHLEFEHS